MSSHTALISSAEASLTELRVFIDRLKAVGPDDPAGEEARHRLAQRLHALARHADPATVN
jgi:hypothetical protein